MSRRKEETPRELLQRWCVVQRELSKALWLVLPSLTDQDCARLGRVLSAPMDEQARALQKFHPERAPRARRRAKAAP